MWSSGPPDTRSEPSHALWSLREDVTVEESPSGEGLVLHNRWGETVLERPEPVVREALRRMSFGPVHLENALRAGRGGSGRQTLLMRALSELQPLIVRSLDLDGGQPLLSAVPLSPHAVFEPVALPADRLLKLSRFAVLRSDGRGFVVESPLALHRVELHRAEALPLLALLASATRPEDAAKAWGQARELAHEALSYLLAAGMLVQSDAEDGVFPPEFAEDTDPALAGWTPNALMFHTRSRLGRHDDVIGAIGEPNADQLPEPAVRLSGRNETIALHRPEWDDVVPEDPPLSVALERRHSTRSYQQAPLTAREIGELLYRCLRVRALRTGAPVGLGGPARTLSDRPYPSAGSAYELEFYLTVVACTGIPRGVYRYDPLGHRLERIGSEPAEELLTCGRFAIDALSSPPLLITMTARFGRVLPEYGGLGYALILKHVGVVMQTLYLVSEAMGLASCAVATGDVEVAARVFATDWRAESSVGEMAVGRRATSEASRADQPWSPANGADWPERAHRHGA
ncbi:SagB family peptide dehydrogenase [Streptomyces sp. NPDC002588]|uniref:SagB/ThcOx family dehydrogenase n=1 Tax=Streptomyces sp. NPDC002588 TaxID=3154419 RepID=UPI003317B37B